MIHSRESFQVIGARVEDIQMSLSNIKRYHSDSLHPDVADLINQIDFSIEEIERRMNEG
jgi:DNA polymerase sigma|tara:strand:+ start:875 stop:1051 length:177 start_codon:yes stop_codon:yes gene_type:complete